MSHPDQIKQFKAQIVQLNHKLIQIEKKVTLKSDYAVCANHEKHVTQILKYYKKIAMPI